MDLSKKKTKEAIQAKVKNMALVDDGFDEFIYQETLRELKEQYGNRAMLNQRELGLALGLSQGFMSTLLQRGDKLPKGVLVSHRQKRTVRYPIVEIAKFIATYAK